MLRDRVCPVFTACLKCHTYFAVLLPHLAAITGPHSLIENGPLTTSLRIGLGHDTHRLEPGGPIRLGGIDVPFEYQLVGHSDADVLLHAITDAILGAAAAGDIGELFPNTDEANRNRDSAVMLKLALEKVQQSGYRLVNLDCIVFAQKPKLTPHKLAMRARIAEILEVDVSTVSVKAKTGEAVGPVGRGEAMMAECIAMLEK